MLNRVLNGRYRIVRKVGSGGMADVYEAFDLVEEGRIVAVKVLKPEYSSDPQYLRRLTREAQAMVSLKNDHVVSLFDMGNDGDIHYLVLEYVDGRTLREYMDEVGRLEPQEAVAIVCDVLDGLAHAHKRGLIHRDVKPQNIMMTEEGVIKLTDFGIAKFAGSTTKTYEGGEAMGSVYYISPEQAKGELVDAQTDIYSVGIMLYEMLTGEPPFSGENAVQVALKHINDSIRPLHNVDDKISLALSDVVARATVKDRSIRYSSAEVMRNDLRRALKNPLSRFAKITREEQKVISSGESEQASETRSQGYFREHLPHFAIIGAVVGVIAVFLVMFIISMSKVENHASKVPNLLGYTVEAAGEYAKNREFTVRVSGSEPSDEYAEGEICGQDPAAQTKAEKGTVINVTVSTGNPVRTVPDLLGYTVEEAERALKAADLMLDSHIEYFMDNTSPVGTVIRQSTKPGETLMVGEVVSITVCGDPSVETAAIPNVSGLTVNAAIEKLKRAGFENYCIIVRTPEELGREYADSTVVSQSPTGGIDVIVDTIRAELYVYRADHGGYKAQFGENVTLPNEKNSVEICILTSLGEVVLYRDEFPAGSHTLPFTGYYWEKGSFTCIIYVNGEVFTTFTKDFA